MILKDHSHVDVFFCHKITLSGVFFGKMILMSSQSILLCGNIIKCLETLPKLSLGYHQIPLLHMVCSTLSFSNACESVQYFSPRNQAHFSRTFYPFTFEPGHDKICLLPHLSNKSEFVHPCSPIRVLFLA